MTLANGRRVAARSRNGPETPAEGKIGLVAFHQRAYRRNIIAAIVHFGLALVAFFVGTRWVQMAAAATIAALLTYYLIIACNVVAA